MRNLVSLINLLTDVRVQRGNPSCRTVRETCKYSDEKQGRLKKRGGKEHLVKRNGKQKKSAINGQQEKG
jgi:hypothetical protein